MKSQISIAPTLKINLTLSLLAACLALVFCSSVNAQETTQQTNAQQMAEEIAKQPIGTTWDLELPPLSNNYHLGEDSKPQPGVPKGIVFSFVLKNPTAFRDTERTITVYVPAEYTGKEPACVFVALDSLGYNISTVFDNLIYKHEMPVAIAIGVAPGVVQPADGGGKTRPDRSFEFDSPTDRLASLILGDVLPMVEQQQTPDGRPILLSRNPDDRGIGGGSTGGIGAFNVAWQRPDAFHRVFTSIGTFVGMRGGEQLYVVVRKTEPKPLRIFMVDGVHDEWPGGPEMGDWFLSNLTMERALEFSGYDVRHTWGQGDHSRNLALAEMPEIMRWLWRDWPKPIVALQPGNPRLQEILQAEEPWKIAVDGCPQALSVAAAMDGNIFVPIHNGGVSPLKSGTPCPTNAQDRAIAFGPDGRAYVAAEGRGIVVYDGNNAIKTLASQLNIQGLTVSSQGAIYATATSASGQGELWLIRPGGEEIKLTEQIKGASAVTLTPDEHWLFVAQRSSHRSLSYRILPDGKVDAGESFYDPNVPILGDDAGLAALVMDRDGRAYGATRIGVQIFNSAGNVTGILPLPGNQPVESLAFGGTDFRSLYAYSGGRVYVRKLKVSGAKPATTKPTTYK